MASVLERFFFCCYIIWSRWSPLDVHCCVLGGLTAGKAPGTGRKNKQHESKMSALGFSFIYKTGARCLNLRKKLEDWTLMPFSFRYRAVASWSRVQGIGIPMITAIEIFSIWLLSFILAIPEAIGFTVVHFKYKDESYVTCMLNPTNNFMLVSNILSSLFGIHII